MPTPHKVLSMQTKHLTKKEKMARQVAESKIKIDRKQLETGAPSWLCEGGHFYVCGDAARMAKDVDETLLEIARVHGKLDDDGALAWRKQLVAEKRYVRDVY